MSPELLTAVKERIDLGHTKADIINELKTAGYSTQMSEDIYEAAFKTSTEELVTPTDTSGELIGYQALLKSSWEMTKANWKLFAKAFFAIAVLLGGLMILMATIVAGGASLEALVEQSPGLMIGVAFGVVLVVLLCAVALATINFSIVKNLTAANDTETFFDSVRWSAKRIFPIIVLGIFTYLATQTGYLFFVIPGIALALYTYFTKYVFATEELRGLDAMVRSTELVYGRFWSMAGRLVVASLFILFVVIVTFLLGAILLGIGSMALKYQMDVVLIALGALVYLSVLLVGISFMHCVTVVLFRSLLTSFVPNTFTGEKKGKIRFWFKLMVIVGPIAAILLQVPSTMSEMNEEKTNLNTENAVVSLSAQANTAYFVSEEYYLNEGGFSYEGVCAQVSVVVEERVEMECNASEDQWAVRLSDATSAWCTDSAGYDKQSYVPLDGGTTCLALPDASELEVSQTATTTE